VRRICKTFAYSWGLGPGQGPQGRHVGNFSVAIGNENPPAIFHPAAARGSLTPNEIHLFLSPEVAVCVACTVKALLLHKALGLIDGGTERNLAENRLHHFRLFADVAGYCTAIWWGNTSTTDDARAHDQEDGIPQSGSSPAPADSSTEGQAAARPAPPALSGSVRSEFGTIATPSAFSSRRISQLRASRKPASAVIGVRNRPRLSSMPRSVS